MKNVWQTRKLGELCEIELGKTPARANEKFWDEKRETGNVWLSIADLLNSQDNVVVDSKEYLSDEGAAICKRVGKGTLLVSFKLTLGRLAFAGRDLFTNEAIAALTIFDERELSKEFLFYFLHFFDWRKAAENDVKLKGMTLNKAKLKEMPVHFPSPVDQKRIVRIVDQALEGIAAAKANAERNLHNARGLFENHLQAVFTRRKGWVACPLADCLDLITYGFTNPMPTVAAGPYMVTAKNVVRGQIDYASTRHTSREAFKTLLTNKSRPKIGDVLLTKDGTLGRLAVVDRADVCINQSVALLRPNGRMEAHFMRYLLSSPGYQKRMIGDADGATIKHIYITRVDKMEVAFPASLREQEGITSGLAALTTETQRLATIYERKLAALGALRKSLLHRAFTGNL